MYLLDDINCQGDDVGRQHPRLMGERTRQRAHTTLDDHYVRDWRLEMFLIALTVVNNKPMGGLSSATAITSHESLRGSVIIN